MKTRCSAWMKWILHPLYCIFHISTVDPSVSISVSVSVSVGVGVGVGVKSSVSRVGLAGW